MSVKDWCTFYLPPEKSAWTGRTDSDFPERFHEWVICHDLSKSLPEAKGFGILGFASDAGVTRNKGRAGAKHGPAAFRKALSAVPTHLNSTKMVYDFGTIICDRDEDLEDAQKALANAVFLLKKNGIFPIVIGGGHEVSWGHYQGLRETYPKEKITLINFDAHFDMRPLDSGPSSGTSFTQIHEDSLGKELLFDYHCFGIQKTANTPALFNRATERAVTYHFADTFFSDFATVQNEFDRCLLRSNHYYCTICLDVFASSFAPGVSAPQPFGLYPWHVLPLLAKLVQSGKLISLDIAELNPTLDIDQHTAKLAAQIAAYVMGL